MCQLPTFSHPDLLVGIESGDDAAVYKVSKDLAIVTTVDFFPPIVDDNPDTDKRRLPAQEVADREHLVTEAWRRLCDLPRLGLMRLHAQCSSRLLLAHDPSKRSIWSPYGSHMVPILLFSIRVYAMGAKPLFAMNIMSFPEDIPKEIMYSILAGGAAKVKEAGVLIVGGHTVKDKEPKYGLSVTGVVKPGFQITNIGANIGDVLILTKPIGTGVITTAAKLERVDRNVIANAVNIMQTLNDKSSEAMISVGVNACTDITGFGLLGHLNRMVKESNVSAKISLQNVPVLDGTLELINKNIVPGGTSNNLKVTNEFVKWEHNIDESSKLLLCDAQTSGGLLISVPHNKANKLLTKLDHLGVSTASVIGEIVPLDDLSNFSIEVIS